MAAETQQIIIEFVSNTEGLQPAEDRLEALGKVDAKSAEVFKKTNTELSKREAALKGIASGTQQVVLGVSKEQAVYNKLVASLKTLSGQSKTTVQDLLKLSPKEVAAGFDNAATSVDDFIKVMQEASDGANDFDKKTKSLKAELKSLTAQLTLLKVAGEDNTEQYKKLAERAGQIQDAFGDVRAEIKDFASDTKTIDNVIGSVQALAGGFAAVQGAAALFGDENKDLQETLVKVTATMSILQGIQGLQNALQKEGALTLAALNIQEKLYNASLAIENGLQSQSVVVRVAATVAQRALNLAMSANPIGLLITALVAIVGIFAFFISRAHDAAVAQGELNQAIKNGAEGLQAYGDGLKRGNEKIVSDLERLGARQSDIQKQNLKTEIALQRARVDEINNLNDVILKNQGSTNKETVELVGKAMEEKAKLEQDNADAITNIHKQTNDIEKQLIAESLQDRVEANKRIFIQAAEGSKQQLAAQKALIQAQANLDANDAGQDAAKRAAILAQANKDILAAEITFRRRELELQKQSIQTQLEGLQNIDATLEQQHALRLKLISIETEAEVNNAALSEKEKAAIRAEGFQKRLAEDKSFNEESRRQTLQAEIDKNAAVLAQREINSSDQLALTLENIDLAAQLEIDATKNNSAKIKGIIAQRDKDIRAAKLANIQADLDYELKLQAAITGVEVRANEDRQQRLGDAFSKRKIGAVDYYNALSKLIDENVGIELAANTKKINALNEEFRQKLISQKDYNLAYAQLIDEQAKIVEDAEKKKRDASKATAEQAKRDAEEIRDFAISTAGEAGNIILSIFQQQLDGQSAQIAAEKQRVEDLQKAGAISDKEAVKRMNDLAQRERRIKYEQAQRDKQQAIFNAVINTALAVSKAYATTGPIAGAVLAAVVGAIGAAQIALIASRPIPAFYKGKKGKYEGLGYVGDRGFELVEREDGSMHVQRKKELMWLGKNDTVYTHDESKKILDSRPVMRQQKDSAVSITNNHFHIDYEKLGREVGKNTKTNVYVDGVLAQQIEQEMLTNYINSRRKYP